nr:MAG TPA: hypothetical protein [Bacteriophage sp.]DAX63237.1 MAG TPA: hypothetical protein [Caudoviricetes sp.]
MNTRVFRCASAAPGRSCTATRRSSRSRRKSSISSTTTIRRVRSTPRWFCLPATR